MLLKNAGMHIKSDFFPIIKWGSPATPARLPIFSLPLRPNRLPECIVDIAFEEVDVPILGDLDAGVAQKF